MWSSGREFFPFAVMRLRGSGGTNATGCEMAMQQPEENSGPSMVLLIDELHLRRAAIGALLRPWAEEVGTTLLEGAPDLGDVASSPPEWGMVILSVGGTHIMQGSTEIELRRLISTAGDVPVVVVSDRQDTAEMIKAFEAGIRGFLPTSTSPDVALKALTFILKGGHFFPPSVLQPSPERGWPKVSAKGADQSNDPESEMRDTIRVDMRRPVRRDIARLPYRAISIVARLRRPSSSCQGGGRKVIRLTVRISHRSLHDNSPRRGAARSKPGLPHTVCSAQVSRIPRLKAAMNGSIM
jgi:DNA-binding NarL/FixJ family response regulator